MSNPTDNSATPSPAGDPAGAPPAANASTKVKENTQGLARVLLIVFVAVCVVGGSYAMVSAMAAMAGLGVIPAFVLALFPVVGLPAFLTVRAALALKRRGQGAIIRRLVGIALVLLTHLAIIGIVSEWVGKTSGDMFATSYLTLETVGGIPYVSPMLKRAAKERNALPLPGSDGGPLLGPDGGPLPMSDGGPVTDGGLAEDPTNATDKKANDGDGGPTVDAKAPIASDAGALLAIANVASSDAAKLSPRRDGGARVLFAASTARNSAGDAVVLVHDVYAYGKVQTRSLSLAPFRGDGSARLVETANDGHVVVLLSSGVVLAASPAGSLAKINALAPGASVLTPDGTDAGTISSTRDVVVGPRGDVVAVVDIIQSNGRAPLPSLVATPKNGVAATLIRQRNNVIDDGIDGDSSAKVFDFDLRRGTGGDRFCIVETFVTGAPVRTKTTGKTFQMNPQRLLVGSTRAPAGAREVARTGSSLVGINARTLQAFQDAVALDDGRVLFDANFVEDGAKGWVFVATPGDAQAYAVAPKSFPKGAAWASAAPRARSLAASDDVFAFIQGPRDAASLVRSSMSGDAVVAKPGATARAADGTSWRITSFHSVAFAEASDWMLTLATVRGDDGKERKALLQANADDIKNAVFLALVVEGFGSDSLARLSFRQDRRDPLWMIAP